MDDKLERDQPPVATRMNVCLDGSASELEKLALSTLRFGVAIMLRKRIGIAVSVLVLCIGVSKLAYTQQATAPTANEHLAKMNLEGVRIEAQGLGQLFSDLSLSYDIPIAMETSLNDDDSVIYHLEFKKGTLSALLTQFVAKHAEYNWEITDGIVHIFPKNNYRDVLLDQMLGVTINKFSIGQQTSCWTVVESLVATPEIKGFLDANGMSYRGRDFSGFYFQQVGREFTLDTSRTTLKSILNTVIRQSPAARFWLITRNRSDHTVFLFLNARHEASPARNEKAGIEH